MVRRNQLSRNIPQKSQSRENADLQSIQNRFEAGSGSAGSTDRIDRYVRLGYIFVTPENYGQTTEKQYSLYPNLCTELLRFS